MTTPLPNDVSIDPLRPKSDDTRLQRYYGVDFPSPEDWEDGEKWRKWVETERRAQEPVMRDKRLHWARHRHFRAGHQWISSRDGRTWREPTPDTNDVRPVLNLIGPALDFRLGLLLEQHPGFRHEPIGGGTAEREAAEAQQAVSEYYFFVLKAWLLFMDALYNAQTDGVSFIHVFIDKTAGPKHADIEVVPPTDPRYTGLKAQGYTVRPDDLLELPFESEGVPAPVGSEPQMLPEGDILSRIVLAHEVIFDAEARSVNGPIDRAKWAVIKRMRDAKVARLEVGKEKIESERSMTSDTDVLDLPMDRAMGWQRGLPPFPTRRQRLVDGVPEYLIFIAPNPKEPLLANGKWLRIVGSVIIEQGDELPGSVIPLARFTDGSADSDIFPRPVVSDWIGDQVAINALLGILLKHARFFAGGRLLAMKNTLLEETYSSIVGSVVEYQGQKPDTMQPVSAGRDAWDLLNFLIKKLEDKMAWNDLSRGQVSGTGSFQDVSGRALLGARELFERTFGPAVRAAAEGATEWAQLVIRYAQYLFDVPRLIPAVGGRGDLAKSIDSKKLGDRPVIYADPSTLMPLPRALRNQMLLELLQMGLITTEQFQKRSPFADIRNAPLADVDQWQRAQWINTMLEENHEQISTIPPEQLYVPGQGIPIFWQDDPGAHLLALNELILDERKPLDLRLLAVARSGVYEQLAMAKADPSIPAPVEVTGVPAIRTALQAAMQQAQAAQATQAQPSAEGKPQTAPGGIAPVTTQAEEQRNQAVPFGALGTEEQAARAEQS